MLSVDPFKTAQDAVDWIKIAASGALALLTLLWFIPFSRGYFVDDFIGHERIVLSVIIAYKLARLLLRREGDENQRPLALACMLAAGSGAWINLTAIHSVALANLSFLGWLCGLCSLMGGLFSSALRLAAAAALMTYPPARFFDPFAELLLKADADVARFFGQWFSPGAHFVFPHVMVAGWRVGFIAPCSGYAFMMVYLAIFLIFCRPHLSSARLTMTLLTVTALAFAVNVARIVFTISLSDFGFAQFALCSGHKLVGQAFILLGLLVILGAPRLFPVE